MFSKGERMKSKFNFNRTFYFQRIVRLLDYEGKMLRVVLKFKNKI